MYMAQEKWTGFKPTLVQQFERFSQHNTLLDWMIGRWRWHYDNYYYLDWMIISGQLELSSLGGCNST